MNLDCDDECTCDVGFGGDCPTCMKQRSSEVDRIIRQLDRDPPTRKSKQNKSPG